MRLRRQSGDHEPVEEPAVVRLDNAQLETLSGVFAAPRWPSGYAPTCFSARSSIPASPSRSSVLPSSSGLTA